MAKIGQKQAETRQREPKIVFLDHQQVPVLGQKKLRNYGQSYRKRAPDRKKI